jgi:para-aminobenzoate synthetase component 1
MAARFARLPGSVVLLSGGELDCARYHILAYKPWLRIVGQSGKTTVIVDDRRFAVDQPPLDAVETVLNRCALSGKEAGPEGPVLAGLFGYLAYDLKDDLEALPRTTIDDLGLPQLYLVAPSLVVVHDTLTGKTRAHAPVRQDRGAPAAEAELDAFRHASRLPSPEGRRFYGDGKRPRANVSRSEHMASVQRIKDYITAGDVYQVNLSQRFEMGFHGDGYALFKSLYRLNPAPFFAYVNAGDHQIVSTSPERFLQRRGKRVESRPIKGTRPRGETPKKDRQMKHALAHSAKDDAELAMIVDLLRNDIGKVCAGGSVAVAQHKRLEAYQNVYHLVSVVEGQLSSGKGAIDLIRATFPGGSITGCPKIRAMEIIDELETVRRHVYTGAIGYISFHDTLDLSIAIRTATIVDQRLVFSVGGGIVYESDPAEEYAETLHKGQTVLSVFKDAPPLPPEATASAPWVWQDGRIMRQNQAAIPVSDLGVQYGFGFFETIRAEKGVACRLQAHMDRFNRTWKVLFNPVPPDVTWLDIIDQVLEKNGLGDAVAAVKIMATRGDPTRQGHNGSLLVTARPYVHRLATSRAAGLTLAIYPHPRMTPLADHKTLNYLYYLQAGEWARQHRADEAVILNPDGSISETNTANLLVVSGKTVTRPRSPYVLPGVMQAELCRRLGERGFSIVERKIQAQAIVDADTVLLTNALIGAVPAMRLDNHPVKIDPALTAMVNQDLFCKRAHTEGR